MGLWNRNRPDVILLHAPSVYDFRKHSILYGPVSDLIPSTPIFEMYPIGFASMASYLKKQGINVRIINLALKMLRDPHLDVESYIRKLRPRIFGIDLHWLPHCHGAIEIARIVKRNHPEIPIVFGGFSSSYFHEELIRYPEADFILRGDSTEKPMAELLNALLNGGSFAEVPNLTWKVDGEVKVNALSYVPDDIDQFDLGYKEVLRSVLRYQDLTGVLPFRDWMRYPIMATMAARGCNCNCVFCGGANYSFKEFLRREKTVFRSPEVLVEEAKNISRLSRGPIFMLGDIRLGGEDYADKVLTGLAKARITNQIIFEFYIPPTEDFFAKVAKLIPHHSYEMSIESHDEAVRLALGKGYTNEAIEKTLEAALKHSCERFDLYFLIGLPKQTAQTVYDTVSYCGDLYEKFNGDKRLRFFVSPLAPFLDPGSRAFESPEKFGYRLLCHTLEQHRQALLNPSWKYILNYETEWMSRDEIVEATYQAALGLNRIKRKWGIIDEKVAEETEERVLRAVHIMREVDEITALDDEEEKKRQLALLKERVDGSSISTVCEKRELEWPIGRKMLNFRAFEILKIALSRD